MFASLKKVAGAAYDAIRSDIVEAESAINSSGNALTRQSVAIAKMNQELAGADGYASRHSWGDRRHDGRGVENCREVLCGRRACPCSLASEMQNPALAGLPLAPPSGQQRCLFSIKSMFSAAKQEVESFASDLDRTQKRLETLPARANNNLQKYSLRLFSAMAEARGNTAIPKGFLAEAEAEVSSYLSSAQAAVTEVANDLARQLLAAEVNSLRHGHKFNR